LKEINEIARDLITALHEPWDIHERYAIAEKFLEVAFVLGTQTARGSTDEHSAPNAVVPEGSTPSGQTTYDDIAPWGV